MGTVRGMALALVAAVGLLALYLWSGRYDVAASRAHTAPVEWLLATARDRSIGAHAEDIVAPPLTDEARVAVGFHEFEGMCAICHGAPGRPPTAIRQGLNPAAPELDLEEVQRRTDAELFWVIKHGLRMTGMPAFGATHDDDDLWSVVAFLRRLPTLGPAEYAAMAREHRYREEEHHHQDGGH